MVVATTESVDRRIRQRVLEAAVKLLNQRGLTSELVREAAAAADCPLERAQIFFSRDEEIVFALYARLAAELEARVADLPARGIAARFRALMLAKLALVSPYKAAFRSMVALSLDRKHELGVMSEQTEIIRNRVSAVFAAAVLGARGRPAHADSLINLLYWLHLSLMFVWTLDITPGNLFTRATINIVSLLLLLSQPLLARSLGNSLLVRLELLLAHRLLPRPDKHTDQLAQQILRLIFRYRRLQPGAGECATDPCAQCLALHLPKVRRFITAGQPIHLLLPAFPAKSPSPRKVLGRLPDMAEELALNFLQNICDDIQKLYAPGARITICSDGHVFSDLVGVADEHVTDYGREVGAIIERIGAHALDCFRLGDLFEVIDDPVMRQHLCEHYAEPLGSIIARTQAHEHHRALFNGIHRFLFEDRVALESEKSRTQVRKECKELAYQVIQRSDAWGRLITDCFPASLRLSIHPQPPHAEKIGILLADADDAWLTPWHSVAVKAQGKFKLMPRHEAEALGATMVNRAGRPSYLEVADKC